MTWDGGSKPKLNVSRTLTALALVALLVALVVGYARLKPLFLALGEIKSATAPLSLIQEEFKRRAHAGWEVMQPYGESATAVGGGLAYTWFARPPDWSESTLASSGAFQESSHDPDFSLSAGWQEFTWELVATDETPLDLSLPPTTYPSSGDLGWLAGYHFTLVPRTSAAEEMHAQLGLPEFTGREEEETVTLSTWTGNEAAVAHEESTAAPDPVAD